MSEPRRISASRLSTLETCSMLFYLQEVMKLPQREWLRTLAGTITHAILDVLAREKHRHHHDWIKDAQTIHASKAVTRLLALWVARTGITPDIAKDIDPMCMVAINHTNFLDEGAIKRFDPEHEFRLTLRNGAIIKGFIDRLVQMPESWRIKDYKTSRNKKTKKEARDAFQSLVYQLYAWKEFKALSPVDYYFLRHPPTKLKPDKHVMTTPAPTPAMLAGFELYLEHMFEVINHFGEEEARSNYCSDKGYCLNVCSYHKPFDYLSVRRKDTGELVANYALDKPPQVVQDGCVMTTEHFAGCVKWNPQ